MAITGIERPESRKIVKHPSGAKTITRIFTYGRGYDYESEMPAINSFDATYGYFQGYSSTLAPGYITVELSYDSEGVGINFAPGDGDTEYWAQTVAEEVPIEYHPAYLTKWNYALWKKRTGGAFDWATDFPGAEAGYDAADDLSDLRLSEIVRWSKDDPGPAWVLVREATKGNDYFLRPARTVFKRQYFRLQSGAEAALAAIGTLVTPGEVFGISGGSWMVTNSNTQYDGKYWVTETSYQHANYTNALGTIGWDTEIYATTTT